MAVLKENIAAEAAHEIHGGHDDKRKYDMVNLTC